MTTHLTKIDQFQSFVSLLLKERLEQSSLSSQEKLGIKMAILHIFEKNFDPQEILYELLDYLEDEVELPDLIPKIENYFSNL